MITEQAQKVLTAFSQTAADIALLIRLGRYKEAEAIAKLLSEGLNDTLEIA